MLIDTAHIDHLRVNFVQEFNTENNVILANNEITTLINNYPKEMTTQLRQWFNDQQRNRSTGTSGSIDEFQGYLKELEESFAQYQKNEKNQIKLKVLIYFAID